MGQNFPDGIVKQVAVEKCTGIGISDDGSAAALHFEGETGRCILALPLHQLEALRMTVMQAMKMAAHRNLNPGGLRFKTPRTFEIGSADDVRGHVLLIVNRHMPDMEAYAFDDASAMKMAQWIADNVQSRAAPKDRRSLFTSSAIPRKIILPGD